MPWLGRRLATQILAFQLLILVGTGLVGFGLALNAVQRRLDAEYQQRALAVARSVAAMPEIARAVAAGDRSGVVQERADAVRRATGTTFVTVFDARGIRYSHPRPERIGRPVSTDPSGALAGRTVLAVETGTLGRSARAKVPLRTAAGQVVGGVSVGVLEATIRQDLGAAVPLIAAYTAIALLIGALASLLLARRLKRETFGLELREIADLLQEREATLRGIREGVVAMDRRGEVRVVNDEARRLLDLPEDAIGRPADELGGGPRLTDLLTGRSAAKDVVLVTGERVLVANRMPVERDGRALGAVVTFRDRTQLEALVRELDSVRGLTDAMRAQAHEFSNRLHTLSGLLQLGYHEDAVAFIQEVSLSDTELRRVVCERVQDPAVAALLLAKSAVAAERGVTLTLGDDLCLAGELTDPLAVLTVLGNLVDNALDAAPTGGGTPRAEVALRTLGDATLWIEVADSGPGVAPTARDAIWEPGYTSKPADGARARGVGLSLVRRLVERHGGTITVEDAQGLGGALFSVRLPDAVRTTAGERDGDPVAAAPTAGEVAP